MGEIVRQTINLYNTVGLVDKDKNIYFVPHQSDIYAKVTANRTKVCDCYHELFNTVSPFSSKYQNVDIDQWSPEDRSLVIDGLIDDFRQSRGQGLALNYLIVTRAIYSVVNEVETLTSHYYQAFFIDSVEQAGSRSVRLSLTPDYFTNFYYLNNNDTLTANYDPFNPVMKNCFIERQHYNRYVKLPDTVQGNRFRPYPNNQKIILGSEESFRYKYQYKDKRLFLPVGVNVDLAEYENFCNDLKAITTKYAFNTFATALTGNKLKWFCELFISYFNIIFKDSILLPTSIAVPSGQSYELHYYKAGFSSYKGVTVPFTHTAVPFITIPKGFENIQKEWFAFDIYHYYENVNKAKHLAFIDGRDVYDTDRIMDYISSIGGSQYILTTYVSKYSPLQSNISGIGSYGDYLTKIIFSFDVKQSNEINVNQDSFDNITEETLVNANKVVTINKNTYAFLPFSYIKKEGFDSHIVGDLSNGVWFKNYQSGTYVSSLFYIDGNGELAITQHDSSSLLAYYTQYSFSDPHHIFDYNVTTLKWNHILFVVAEHTLDNGVLSMNEQTAISLDKFIDPLLEADPYSFFSISINESEQIISKIKTLDTYRTLQNEYRIQLQPILSYNDSYKVGLIPSYYIVNKWERYYSEAIVTIISSQVPIIEDSWITYYQTNKAQMKNQYAVQSTRFDEGYAQTLSQMPFDIATGIVKQGEAGAIAGAISGIGGLVRTIVSDKYQVDRIQLSQRAKLSDMGAKPDTVKFAGSDILYDMIQNERGFYLNYYRIDEVSYNSACKYLERFGYKVNIFDTINVFDRIGLNFVKITSFDFVEDNFVLSQEQMEAISTIFANGVTLLHNHAYLHNLGEVINNVSYHNYELILAN